MNSSSRCGRVAQLGEHLLCKQGVAGSNPVTSTKFYFTLEDYADIRCRIRSGGGFVVLNLVVLNRLTERLMARSGRHVASRTVLRYCGWMTTKRVVEPRFTKSNTD